VSSVFGQIAVASQVENAVRDLLRKWFPTYLREIERIMEWEREPLPAPRNYTNRNAFDAQAGEEIPKVVVISPGLFTLPTHPQGGYYKAIWHVGVGVATAAPTEEQADEQCKMYGAAARAILLQHQDLELPDTVTAVYWYDESYSDLPGYSDQLATYRSAGVFVGVEVTQAINRYMTPPEVSEAPQITETVEEVVTEIDRSDDGHGVTVITS
jgi:hypothetical protein